MKEAMEIIRREARYTFGATGEMPFTVYMVIGDSIAHIPVGALTSVEDVEPIGQAVLGPIFSLAAIMPNLTGIVQVMEGLTMREPKINQMTAEDKEAIRGLLEGAHRLEDLPDHLKLEVVALIGESMDGKTYLQTMVIDRPDEATEVPPSIRQDLMVDLETEYGAEGVEYGGRMTVGVHRLRAALNDNKRVMRGFAPQILSL